MSYCSSLCCFFFFFKQKTAYEIYQCDWSSDVCSSDLAINATLFGTARLGMVMAQEKALPTVFSHKERGTDIPWVSLLSITGPALLFVNTTDLAIISSFASSTFLLIFAAINLSALRLRHRIGLRWFLPLVGLLLSMTSWLMLVGYLWSTDPSSLLWIVGFYAVVIVFELLRSEEHTSELQSH